MKKLLLVLLFFPLISFDQEVKVTRVIDGDTFEIEGGEKVRMIGINAPELSEKFGLEAKNHLKKLIENKKVILIKGELTKNKGFYQRLLRYVYFDKEDINLKMIKEGYAFAYLKYKFSKSVKYKTEEIKSKGNALGFWAERQDDIINEKGFENLITPKQFLISTLTFLLVIFGVYYSIK